jgi:hypothetical protein
MGESLIRFQQPVVFKVIRAQHVQVLRIKRIGCRIIQRGEWEKWETRKLEVSVRIRRAIALLRRAANIAQSIARTRRGRLTAAAVTQDAVNLLISTWSNEQQFYRH